MPFLGFLYYVLISRSTGHQGGQDADSMWDKKGLVACQIRFEVHPIIEHVIETLQIREISSTYVRTDERMKLDDDKVITFKKSPQSIVEPFYCADPP